ncbi:MAG: hypothetical protein AAGF12_15205 [Myxococcota bacterium]
MSAPDSPRLGADRCIVAELLLDESHRNFEERPWVACTANWRRGTS